MYTYVYPPTMPCGIAGHAAVTATSNRQRCTIGWTGGLPALGAQSVPGDEAGDRGRWRIDAGDPCDPCDGRPVSFSHCSGLQHCVSCAPALRWIESALDMLAKPPPGPGSPLPHLHRDWARPCHSCAGTGLTPCQTSTGTGLAPATSAPGPAGLAPAASAPGHQARRCHISRRE